MDTHLLGPSAGTPQQASSSGADEESNGTVPFKLFLFQVRLPPLPRTVSCPRRQKLHLIGGQPLRLPAFLRCPWRVVRAAGRLC